MANASPFVSYRDGDWSRHCSIPDSPWWSPQNADLDTVPDGVAEDDLGYQVSIYHKVRLDMDVSIGGSFPASPWTPPTFSPSAGSTVTRLPTGLYRVGYQIAGANGTSSGGNSETAQVSIVNGVSKPRVTFPSAPPTGLTYTLFMTSGTGYSGHENYYCRGITGAYVDLVTELWYTPYASLSSPPVIDTVAGWPSVDGSHAFVSTQYDGANFTNLGTTNALTIFPGGALTLGAGYTLTLNGDLWIASAPTSGDDFLVLEPGARIAFRNTQANVTTWADYQMWFAGGGRIRVIGGS